MNLHHIYNTDTINIIKTLENVLETEMYELENADNNSTFYCKKSYQEYINALRNIGGFIRYKIKCNI